jgi:hypothetical protein
VTGPLTLRADSGFYAHDVIAARRRLDVRFSVTLRIPGGVRRLIEAIPEDAWTPIPYCDRGRGGRRRDQLHPVPQPRLDDGRPVPADRALGAAEGRVPARAFHALRLGRGRPALAAETASEGWPGPRRGLDPAPAPVAGSGADASSGPMASLGPRRVTGKRALIWADRA